ncbi:Ribonuclease BN [Fulvivirga imtechensis AK7]|uniref:Ribonuclease BN n=1 Tax=Fulvivirga imtechensis AK7 TaxID=1237149 RepID=L8JXW1_9BACT|nr:YihY/virulence factor BrkB family protein [Fulvivirga imtechensis]ELR73896.1 Ribonuclease BN [Fulvivirga imtechensis AK7]
MNIKKAGKIIAKSFHVLKRSQPLLLASSTAFFTLFASAPILIILFNILSLYFRQDTLSTEAYQHMAGWFGVDTADQIRNIADNFRKQASSKWITIGGSIFLAFVATTLLHIIRQAFDQIWKIRLKKSRKIQHNIKQRLSAFALILVGGILFSISILTDAAITLLKDYLDQIIPSVNALVIRGVNELISLLIATLWFAILFRYLPNARIKSKYAIIGGFFTAILFDIGKFLLGRLLITDNLNNIFGASASIMLLLLFIFYASLIMYFGAAFVLVYMKEKGHHIQPKKNAERYEHRTLV